MGRGAVTDAALVHDGELHHRLLIEVQDLRAYMEREEGTLNRIERLLDGNGQPGLVRGHVSMDERLKSLEGWKAWMVGFIVTSGLAAVATAIQVTLHFWPHRGMP